MEQGLTVAVRYEFIFQNLYDQRDKLFLTQKLFDTSNIIFTITIYFSVSSKIPINLSIIQ
jgi:hypothetical protein